MISRRLRLWLVASALWLGFASAAPAQRSYATSFDKAQGLDIGEIGALAQDGAGFLWIGGNGGLVRFDGRSFERWAAGDIHARVTAVLAGPGTEVVAVTESGDAYAVAGGGARRLTAPNGEAARRVSSAVFDSAGRLWAVIGDRLWVRKAAGGWTEIPVAALGGERAKRLSRLQRGVGVVTEKGAWALREPTGQGVSLMRAHRLFAIAETKDETFWIAGQYQADLWRKDANHLQAVGRPIGRLMSMIERDGVVWVSIDRALLSIDEAGHRRLQGPAQGLASGGPLLVDREDGLWLGTFVGLTHFAEPDTLQWTEAEGLPSNHLHGVVVAGGTLWANSWQGAARLSLEDAEARPHHALWADGNLCGDGRDGVWIASDGHLLHWRAGRYQRVFDSRQGRNFLLAGCAATADAPAWIATSAGLFVAGLDGGKARLLTRGLHGRVGIGAVWRGAGQAIWLADEQEACRFDRAATPDAARLGEPAACVSLPSNADLSDGVEIRPGVEWLPLSSGLVEIRDGGARLLPGNLDLPGASIQRLVPARGGGFWAMGPGVILRIAPCSGCAEGWKVLEAPGAGQGLPGNSARDAVELSDGELWVAGNRGLFKIPAADRRPSPTPVGTALVGATIDGRPINPARPARLRPDQHRLELTFAAPSFRDPARLLYRYRLSEGAAWSEPSREPVLQLIDQAPGRYRAQMQTSLDAGSWNAPASFDFSVDAPWWASWPARLLYVAATAAVLWLAYMVRVRHLLSLQRQRLGIAMDLHDELGSSLSSIGALAQVAGHDDVPPEDRRRLTREIVTTAQLAGAGLRSLVWTLREGAVDAAALGREIAEQARRLVPAESPRLVFDLPGEDGAALIDAAQRRDVLMVFLEATHNVVRHAGAKMLEVSLKVDAERWRLRVRDDGRGFDPSLASLGAGMETMRRRAEQIGGQLEIVSTPGGGACVTLTFHPGHRAKGGLRRRSVRAESVRG